MIISDLDYLQSIDDTSSVTGGTTFGSLDSYLDKLFRNFFAESSNITAPSSFSTSASSENGNRVRVSISTEGVGRSTSFARAGDLVARVFS